MLTVKSKRERGLKSSFYYVFAISLLLLAASTLMMTGAVEKASATISLNWTAPTTNTDGTPLTDLQGYKVYYGSGSPCNYTTTLNAGNVTTYLINLASGTYCFAVTAYDTAGNESAYSNIVYKTEAASDTTAPTVTVFIVPATATSLTVPISSFTATDDVGVTGYMIKESATAPLATVSGWSATAPTSYTVATAGSKTLYAWAKDAAGNVSASRNARVMADSTPPTVSSFSIPATMTVSSGRTNSPAGTTAYAVAIGSFTATDNLSIAAYMITESAVAPSATASGWTAMAPYSYNLSTAGTHTIYAWAKDAVGNVSKPKSASVNIIVVDTGTKTDGVAIFFKGVWYIDTNGNGMWDGAATDTLYPDFGHGLSDAMPVTGDWDDTGVVRVGVFSNGSWYLDMKGDGVWDGGVVDKVIPNFGQGLPNAIPVTGDWNGSGTTKIGVFSNGSWYLDMKGDGVWDGGVVDKVIPNFGQGLPNAIPVTGDWNGSGTTKIGVFSNGSWYLDMKGDGDWDGGAVDKVILDFGTRLNGAIPVIMKNK